MKYNFLLFIRNLRRQKLFSFINLLGLTTGLVSTLLIYVYIQHELSHDRFHSKADRIYRINQTFIWGEDNNQIFSSTGPGVSMALSAEIPEVEEVVRVHPPGNLLMAYRDGKSQANAYDQEGILAVDSNFFSVFTFPLIKGDPSTALKEPNSIVLTESAAKKYFGEEDPVGKLIQSGNFVFDETSSENNQQGSQTFEVTGVVKDPPANSYIDFEVLMSMSSFPRVKNPTWIWTTFETFVVLHENASVEAVRSKLNTLPKKYADATLQRAMGTTFEEYTKNGKQWNLYLQPLTDIHLYSGSLYNRLNDVGNIKILYILTGIVIFIILLSCINFMNLSTAQYTRRIKETSLRKVLGSDRWQLGRAFFMEAFLFCSISLILGMGLTQLFLPYFNIITGNHYELNLLSDRIGIIVIFGLLLIMSLLSGCYPAIFLSAFKPVEALNGKLKSGKEGRFFRNGLVVFQFSTSIILIVSTLIVFQQLRFLSEKDVGFNRENLVVLDRLEWVNDKETLLNSLTQIPGVSQATWCSSVPPNLYDGDGFKAEGDQEKNFNLNYIKADENFIPALELQLVVGRNFLKGNPSDANGVLLNETAAKHLGWAIDDSVIGKKIFYPGDENRFEVIGVMKDFNYWALQASIQPMALFNINSDLFSSKRQYAALRISGNTMTDWTELISKIQEQWKYYAGDTPFHYEFVDQAFAASFEGELKFGQALSIFAGLAIIIACLGLLGMIVFTIELRTKEIGIRKVIGASAVNILFLISKDYTRLIAMAILISVPVSVWLMKEWLSGFEYRIPLTPWVFIVAGICTFTIALLITGYHSLKAALTNPVDVLRDE